MSTLRFFRNWWPTGLVLAVIIYATWVPQPIDPDDIPPLPHIDKLIHAVMMGGLASALLFDWHRMAPAVHLLSRRVVWTVIAAVVGFSVVDEVVQGLLPIERPSDWLDFVADVVGAIVGALLARPAINAIFRRLSR